MWTIGDDEIPIREGKVQDHRVELITFADDKQFTAVPTVKGDELEGVGRTIPVILQAGRVSGCAG